MPIHKKRKCHELKRVLAAIERISGDDFCEDLALRSFRSKPIEGDLKEAEKKLTDIFRLAHAFNKYHACYNVHYDWREELKKYES